VNPLLPALLLFVSQTITVLLLVVQSRLNIHGHTRLAGVNSLLIGTTQLVMWRIMPNPSGIEIAAFLCAGPTGNFIAQWINRHDVARIRKLHKD
jgi:hypothetical protein